jgi:hypothetical protein
MAEMKPPDQGSVPSPDPTLGNVLPGFPADDLVDRRMSYAVPNGKIRLRHTVGNGVPDRPDVTLRELGVVAVLTPRQPFGVQDGTVDLRPSPLGFPVSGVLLRRAFPKVVRTNARFDIAAVEGAHFGSERSPKVQLKRKPVDALQPEGTLGSTPRSELSIPVGTDATSPQPTSVGVDDDLRPEPFSVGHQLVGGHLSNVSPWGGE